MPVRDGPNLLGANQGPQVVQGKTNVHILLVCAAVKVRAGVRHRQVFIGDIAGYDAVIALVTRKWPVIGPVDRSRCYDGDPGVGQLRGFYPGSLFKRRGVSPA